jgi:hypothetical protein
VSLAGHHRVPRSSEARHPQAVPDRSTLRWPPPRPRQVPPSRKEAWARLGGRLMRPVMKKGGIYPKVVTLPLAEGLPIISLAYAVIILRLLRASRPARSALTPLPSRRGSVRSPPLSTKSRSSCQGSPPPNAPRWSHCSPDDAVADHERDTELLKAKVGAHGGDHRASTPGVLGLSKGGTQAASAQWPRPLLTSLSKQRDACPLCAYYQAASGDLRGCAWSNTASRSL